MCRDVTIWYLCCGMLSEKTRRNRCKYSWYRPCEEVPHDIEDADAPCADCKFKRECQRLCGIDPSAQLETKSARSLNRGQLQGVMPHSTQHWQFPGEMSDLPGHGGLRFQQARECQTAALASGGSEYQAQGTEIIGEQQQEWERWVDWDGGCPTQDQQRLTSFLNRRQSPTNNSQASTAMLIHKRKRASRIQEGDAEKKQNKRQKTAKVRSKTPNEQARVTEEQNDITAHVVKEQCRDKYRAHAFQELMKSPEMPQKLQMIIRELAQEYGVDMPPEKDLLKVEASKKQAHYTKQTDVPNSEQRPTAYEDHTQILEEAQLSIVCEDLQPIPIKEESSGVEQMEQSEIDEQEPESNEDEELQIEICQQKLNAESIENQSIDGQRPEVQSHISEADRDPVTPFQESFELYLMHFEEYLELSVPLGIDVSDTTIDDYT